MTAAVPPIDVGTVLSSLGTRLRQLRHTRAMTLAELARRTGIPQSTLSRIESGARRPGLAMVLTLAAAYGVTVDELIGAPATGDPRIHVRPTVRYGMTWLPLTRQPGGIQAYKLILPVASSSTMPEQRSHEGYEWMYVLSGRLHLTLGENDIVLVSGEVAEFDTHTPHAFNNPGQVPAEVLIMVGPQGERAHVRVRPRR